MALNQSKKCNSASYQRFRKIKMEKIKKVISLSLAKRMSELAKEKGITLSKSECWWVDAGGSIEEYVLYCGNERNKNYFPAYDCSELSEMLPIEIDYYDLYLFPKKDGWVCEYSIIEDGKSKQFCNVKRENLAEAMGKMYLYLLENDLIK